MKAEIKKKITQRKCKLHIWSVQSYNFWPLLLLIRFLSLDIFAHSPMLPLFWPYLKLFLFFYFFFFNLHAFLKSRIHASCLFHDCLFTQVQVFPFFPFLIWHFSYVWLWFPKRSNSLRTKIMPVKLSLLLLCSRV